MVTIIDTLHSDMIHDAQFDFPGKRVATCSSDTTVRIYQVESSGITSQPGTESNKQKHRLIAILDGHDGPVWQVCWAHPKFGSLLASCSYDKKVILWKEIDEPSSMNNPSIVTNSGTGTKWTKFHEYTDFKSSVNSIIFAPHELGLLLACCSSDGTASVIDYTKIGNGSQKDAGEPEVKRIPQCHSNGCNAISWAPSVPPRALLSNSAYEKQQKKFVTAGCDNAVKIWQFVEERDKWELEETLNGHSDWVRDVAWAPSVGLPISTIASCSQDGSVIIWRKQFGEEGEGINNIYTPQKLCQFEDVVWHVSWSFTGNILAVSGGDNEVTLWKEIEDNKWEKISEVNKSDKMT